MHHEDASFAADAPPRAAELLRTARGTRAQLSESDMAMPRHASPEARHVVAGLLDRAAQA